MTVLLEYSRVDELPSVPCTDSHWTIGRQTQSPHARIHRSLRARSLDIHRAPTVLLSESNVLELDGARPVTATFAWRRRRNGGSMGHSFNISLLVNLEKPSS